MRPLTVALLAAVLALLLWSGVRYIAVPDAFGALMRHDNAAAALAAVPKHASGTGAPTPAGGKGAQPVAHAASNPASHDAIRSESPTPRERLAALRAPLSPEASNDPFSVQSWLPPPPPPPPAPPAAVVQEPAPTAPPLPFSYVGTFNRDKDKPQVFLANGDQLLIVSPGDLIDGRYRFESIAATEAVFTYLPLNERQVMTIEGDETK